MCCLSLPEEQGNGWEEAFVLQLLHAPHNIECQVMQRAHAEDPAVLTNERQASQRSERLETIDEGSHETDTTDRTMHTHPVAL